MMRIIIALIVSCFSSYIIHAQSMECVHKGYYKDAGELPWMQITQVYPDLIQIKDSSIYDLLDSVENYRCLCVFTRRNLPDFNVISVDADFSEIQIDIMQREHNKCQLLLETFWTTGKLQGCVLHNGKLYILVSSYCLEDHIIRTNEKVDMTELTNTETLHFEDFVPLGIKESRFPLDFLRLTYIRKENGFMLIDKDICIQDEDSIPNLYPENIHYSKCKYIKRDLYIESPYVIEKIRGIAIIAVEFDNIHTMNIKHIHQINNFYIDSASTIIFSWPQGHEQNYSSDEYEMWLFYKQKIYDLAYSLKYWVPKRYHWMYGKKFFHTKGLDDLSIKEYKVSKNEIFYINFVICPANPIGKQKK